MQPTALALFMAKFKFSFNKKIKPFFDKYLKVISYLLIYQELFLEQRD
jgi:hypothetical protein